MKDFKLEIVWLAPGDLIPYANNAKIHTDEQVNGILSSILKFGFDQPISIDRNKVLIKGHGRQLAAIKGGLKLVPCVIRNDLDEYEVMAARLADNELARGEYDANKLKFDLGTLKRNDFDLKLTAFKLHDIERMLIEPVQREQGSSQSSASSQESKQEQSKSENQFIVTVHCKDEVDMQGVYDEMIGKGYECKLIT